MKRRPRPAERTSLRFWFFFWSMVLLGATAWAIWDEAKVRRPWKDYQREFHRLEYQRILTEYEKAKEQFQAPETKQTLENLQEKLIQAEGRIGGPEYQKARHDLEVLKNRLADVSQSWQFTKSELEEAYYWYEKALPEGDRDKVQRRKVEVDRLTERERGLNREVEELTKRVEAQSRTVKQFTQDVEEVKGKIAELQAPLIDLQRRLEVIKNRPLEVKQVVIEGLDVNEFKQPIARVDRCMTCHLGIDRPGFEEVPQKVFQTHPDRELVFATHPIARFGCTICHQGQGPALDSVEWAHGYMERWDFPLLKRELVHASCRRCHKEQDEVQLAPFYTQGKTLFETMGCFGCHNVRGYEKAEKVGPDLLRIKAKVDPSWLIRWIQNPKGYLPRTKMPNFTLREDEAISIAAYLLQASDLEEPPLGQYPGGEPAKGKELVAKLGCLGCHRVGDEFPPPPQPAKMDPAEEILTRFDFAPDLGQVGSKVNADWLFRWVKDPKRFRPTTKMPNLRLSDEEAGHITAYLMTLGGNRPIKELEQELQRPERVKEGERLILKRGCFGCHEIKGFEKAERIAPDLSAFGRKRLLELFFGHAFHVKETWEDWAFWKLKDPQIYQTEQAPQIMPNFGFTDQEVLALRVWLKSLTGDVAPEGYARTLSDQEKAFQEGRRLVRKYNCVGCHIVEVKGGKIRAYYDSPNLAPPPLEVGELHEGEKVQAPWLFSFLKRPIPLRPWLQVRMPTFGLSDEEATGLVRYFAILGRQRFPYEFVNGMAPREHLQAGRTLVSKDYLDCFSCHQQGERKPEGPPEGWAPDLTLAKTRLRPDWIVKWLQDPQKIQPGTKMPTFFADKDSGPEDILGGDEE
ncbi:MAG: c-type cytochrome, partial [candidate division NC10 bacterium]|nr:c-type cytochrome [candidate division NC10 bacterium]